MNIRGNYAKLFKKKFFKSGVIIFIGIILVLVSLIVFIPKSKSTEQNLGEDSSAFSFSLPGTSTLIPTIPKVTNTNTPLKNNEEPNLPGTSSVSLLSSATPIITSSPRIAFLSKTNPKDGAILVNIPASEFWMGSESEWDPYFWGAESPSHKVFLDAFWIYQTEVTNAQYQQCVDARACHKPELTNSETRREYYGNPQYDDYPVIFVSYTHAVSYCNWAGAKLPTEAQWEKAARGTGKDLFPWGNDLPDGNLTNYCDVNCTESYRDKSNDDGYRDTAPVGNYPTGKSPYGIYDMSGNVWEWVFDYFSAGFYQESMYENPRGPASSNTRVVRGGSFMNDETGLRTVARYYQDPSRAKNFLGFRCVINED